MRCYRRLKPVKAISFDLDDTLYDNTPILQKAEQAQLDFLHLKVPQSRQTTSKDWIAIRYQLLQIQPDLIHDIGKFRQQGIYHAVRQMGIDDTQAEHISQEAFKVFYQQRNQIQLSAAVMTTLQQLAKHYPLIALTNGNASIEAIGLSGLFEFAIGSGDLGLQQKPSTDMFDVALKRLGIQNHELLHVGDSLTSDVQGALNAGCGSVWFNPYHRRHANHCPLPDIEIDDLQSLRLL
jgi:HAD superfamily hydrolase (TIGR01549 family)